jgi:phage major head subunit gpT-like protein
MPGPTPSNYAAWITTVDTTIGHLYTQLNPKVTFKQWATELPMKGSIYSMGWTGRMPKARPWFGSRVVHTPAPQTYQVEPIPYELTYAIDRFILEDSDVNGESIFWRMLPDMVRQWQMQPEYELRDLLENTGIQTGARQNGTDGLTNYNTAHPIDIYNPGFSGGNALFSGGTYCNDFRGGVSINSVTVGGALSTTAFTSVCEYMSLIPGEDGEALGVMPDTMLVPGTLMVEAMFILQATLLAPPTYGAFAPSATQVGTSDNQLAKIGVRPVVDHFLRSTKNWYLMDCSHPAAKPLVFLTREAPRTVPRINENDPIVFDSHRYTWGGWDRVAPAWDYPFMSAKSGPTAGA